MKESTKSLGYLFDCWFSHAHGGTELKLRFERILLFLVPFPTLKLQRFQGKFLRRVLSKNRVKMDVASIEFVTTKAKQIMKYGLLVCQRPSGEFSAITPILKYEIGKLHSVCLLPCLLWLSLAQETSLRSKKTVLSTPSYQKIKRSLSFVIVSVTSLLIRPKCQSSPEASFDWLIKQLKTLERPLGWKILK